MQSSLEGVEGLFPLPEILQVGGQGAINAKYVNWMKEGRLVISAQL